MRICELEPNTSLAGFLVMNDLNIKPAVSHAAPIMMTQQKGFLYQNAWYVCITVRRPNITPKRMAAPNETQ